MNTKVINTQRVTPSQLRELLISCIQAGINIHIEGPSGVGKTEMVDQVCTEMTLPLFKHRPADCEPSDFRGMPAVIGTDNDANPIMKFSRPEDIPPAKGKCVWYLDELNRANRSVMNSIMQATDSTKRVGNHKLSQDCVVIAAGNPASDNQYDVGELDYALHNRFLHLYVDYSVGDLLTYAAKNHWNQDTINFIKLNQSNLLGIESCTPRSLERLSRITEHAKVTSRGNALALFQGCIGPSLGVSYYACVFELRPVSFADLQTQDGKARLDSHCKEQGYRADLLGLTLDSIVESLEGKTTVSDVEVEAVQYYLRTIQAEQSASAIATLASKCKQVLLHPTIAKDTKLRDRLSRVK